MSDNINHPPHYEASRIVLEPINLCECYDFRFGNALKYLFRAGLKAGATEREDLQKAKWYLERTVDWMREDPESHVTWPVTVPHDYAAALAELFLTRTENPYLQALLREVSGSKRIRVAILVENINLCVTLIDRRTTEIDSSGSPEEIDEKTAEIIRRLDACVTCGEINNLRNEAAKLFGEELNPTLREAFAMRRHQITFSDI